MPACGYEFYLLVFNSISHSFAELSREISKVTFEDKIRIHARSCNILYLLYKHQWNTKWAFPRKLHIFTREDNMLSSHVKRSPSLWLHNKSRLFHRSLSGVYIIKRLTLKTQQRFSVFGTCFDVSNIIISHYEYIVKIYKSGRYI